MLRTWNYLIRIASNVIFILPIFRFYLFIFYTIRWSVILYVMETLADASQKISSLENEIYHQTLWKTVKRCLFRRKQAQYFRLVSHVSKLPYKILPLYYTLICCLTDRNNIFVRIHFMLSRKQISIISLRIHFISPNECFDIWVCFF